MNLNEINAEIARLENANTNYATCEKLAILYAVRDRLQPVSYSYAEAPLPLTKSEFIEAFESAPTEHALNVINEHMDAIKALYPKEYSAVIEKIKQF